IPLIYCLEFTKKVRVAVRMLPLIMITSEAARYMVVEAVKAGVTDYIVKPIVGRQLWEKIGIYFRK
ncbi:MAG: response regulator, partial [Leptospiraceae bacterium]|nr:response regulator [Leptospiraceae bacterium]